MGKQWPSPLSTSISMHVNQHTHIYSFQFAANPMFWVRNNFSEERLDHSLETKTKPKSNFLQGGGCRSREGSGTHQEVEVIPY